MIIGTAGHIDHGKSALVTALTGRTVDRLEEERRRGITIELNFAPLAFPGLPTAGIIDVPGHEDLIRTMVAGATGLDVVLLVIDLAEGPRPQTEEHLTILEQLRVPRGIPVFTKADLVDRDWADLVIGETRPRLARSPVAFEAPAVVSAVTGEGIDALRARLRERVAADATKAAPGAFRMPVDRVFSVPGVGTVVTGTTWSGSVQVGDTVQLLPAGLEARIRSVEAYGAATPAAAPAVRTALGLAGVDRDAVARGDMVATGVWEPSGVADVELELIAAAPRALAHRTRVRVHHGTSEVLARIATTNPLEPGATGLARLILERPLMLRTGDRFVLRSYSPVATIGGGRVVDPLPPRRTRVAALDPELAGHDQLAMLVERRPSGVPLDALQQLGASADHPDPKALARARLVPVGRRLVHRTALAAIRAEVLALVGRHHESEPTEAGMSLETLRSRIRRPGDLVEAVLAELVRNEVVRVGKGIVALAGFQPTLLGGTGGVERVIEFVAARGLEAPTIAEIAEAVGVPQVVPLLRQAVAEGTVAAVDRERFASRAALDGFTATLEVLGAGGDITPAALRERLGLTRKYLIPLLEWADRQGVTRRAGDVRVLVKTGR